MKLILANNHTEPFVKFYDDLKKRSPTPFDYSSYTDLLFSFDSDAEKRVTVYNVATKSHIDDYDGIYINGYLNSYELAVAVAISADALNISYVNQELHDAPSLSKLSMYAKLVAANVRVPKTIAGTKAVLVTAAAQLQSVSYPSVLKRADADRGIDNFKVESAEEALEILSNHDDKTIWLIQEYVENEGFYLVSYYDSEAKFSIYRTLESRPDENKQKAHMFKPKGGANASLIPLDQVPGQVTSECQSAIQAMNRQIGSVDCIYDKQSGKAYILEVNYNPQLVTIETFKEVRIEAFLDNLEKI